MTETPEIRDDDALIVIDVQNDFCAGGALAVPDGDAVVPVVNALAGRYPVCVATQDWHPQQHSSFASSHSGKNPFDQIDMPYGPQTLWPDHCVQGSSGADFHAELDAAPFEMIVRKGFRQPIDSYSAFYENDHTTPTGLTGYLRTRGVKRVICVGLAYDFCVRFSAEDARRDGFETVVLTSACRGIDMDGSVAAATEALKSAGVALL